MRNKKSSIFGLIILVLIAVVCVALLNNNNSSDTQENQDSQSSQTNDTSDTSIQSFPTKNTSNVNSDSSSTTTESTQNFPQQQLQDILIKYTSNNLNVRELPQHDSSLVCTITNFYTRLYFYGETAEGKGSDGNYHTWYKIITDDSNISGWVRSDFVVSQDANIQYPYASDNEGTDYWKYTNLDLNVRSEPSHNSELVGTVTDCNTYIHSCYPNIPLRTGLGSDGQLHEWVRVLVNSKLEGWVRLDLVIETNSRAWVDDIFVKNTSIPLNVRSLPQHNSDLIISIEKADTKMYYNGVSKQGLGSDGIMHEWYQVDISNTMRGWVRSDLVRSVINL